MTELSKLLTFMYDEDRQRALKMYERMFNIAEDDQGLIQHLMSPTRQAVVIARAYDAKERKLSVSSQKKGDEFEDGDDVPPFVLAINRIFDELFPEEDPEQGQVEDQVSFFDLGVDPGKAAVKKPVMPKAEVLLSDTQNFVAILPSNKPEKAEAEEEETPEGQEEDEASEKAPETESETEKIVGEQSAEEATADPSEYRRERTPATGREVPILSFTFDEEEKEAGGGTDETAEEAEKAEKPKPEPEPEPESESKPEFEPVKEPEEPEKDLVQTVQDLFPEEKPKIIVEKPREQTEEAPRRRRRSVPMKQVTNVPMLVLFLLAAIPITLVLLALLLILTLASLATSLGLIALGVTLVLAAFSGFAVLADVLMLFGAALISLSLGLVFLWITIWLVGGVMVSLVRWVCELGRKWCTKEVPAI